MQELKYLVEDFRDSMTYASKKQPLVLILDSLDQLDSVDGGRHLYWLPRKLPANVYLVLSTLPQEQYGCYPRLKVLHSLGFSGSLLKGYSSSLYIHDD